MSEFQFPYSDYEKTLGYNGEPADEKDLKEVRGRTDGSGFVPEDPKKAFQYYLKKRRNALQNQNLNHVQKIELFRYYNGRLLNVLAKNTDLKWVIQRKNIIGMNNLADKFVKAFRERLLSVLHSEHYDLLPGMSITTSQGFEKEFYGFAFDMKITSVSRGNDDEAEYSFELKDKSNNKEYIGMIRANIPENQIAVQLMETLSQNSSYGSSIPRGLPGSSEEAKALMGLTYLVRCPEFENRVYGGKRMETSKSSATGPMIADVGKESKERVIPFRRRVVDSASQAWEAARGLTNSLQPELRDYVREEFGDIFYNVHFVKFSKNDKEGRWSDALSRSIDSAGCVGVCYDDRSQLENLIDRALERGEKAVISIYGANPPRELEELPPAHVKRPHLRRLNRVVLVLGGGFTGIQTEQIRQLFKQKRDGKQLTPEQEKQLHEFLNLYDINDPTQVDFQNADMNHAHFSDGSQQGRHNRGGGGGGNYIIRPKKMV